MPLSLFYCSKSVVMRSNNNNKKRNQIQQQLFSPGVYPQTLVLRLSLSASKNVSLMLRITFLCRYILNFSPLIYEHLLFFPQMETQK